MHAGCPLEEPREISEVKRALIRSLKGSSGKKMIDPHLLEELDEKDGYVEPFLKRKGNHY
jgi:hypothetical protein